MMKHEGDCEGLAVRDAVTEGFAEVGAALDGGGACVVGAWEAVTVVRVGKGDGLDEVGAAELALGDGDRLVVANSRVDGVGPALDGGAAEVLVAGAGVGAWPPLPNMRNPTTAMPAHPPVTMSPTPRRRCPRRPLRRSPVESYEPDSSLGKVTVSGSASPPEV